MSLDQDITRFRHRPRKIVQLATILNQSLCRLFLNANDRGRLNRGKTEMRYLAGRLKPAHQCVNRDDPIYSVRNAPAAKAKMSDLSLRRGRNPKRESRRGGE